MKILKKIFFFKLLMIFFFSSMSYNATSKSDDNEKNNICFAVVTMTDSLLSNLPCSKYQFNITLAGPKAKFVIKYGDGAKDSLVSPPIIPSTLSYIHQYTSAGTYTVLATLYAGCGAIGNATLIVNVTCGPPPCPLIATFTNVKLPGTYTCEKFEVNANITGYAGPVCPTSSLTATWNFGDGSPTSTNCADGGGAANVHEYLTAGSFTVTLTITGPGTCVTTATQVITVTCTTLPCADCIPSFAPIPGKKYVLSAWVKEKNPPQSKTSYTYPNIYIIYPSLSFTTTAFIASGQIVDGWQRIEGEFLIPSTATDLKIKLDCATGDCFFDDIRVFPFDGSMKSYVYNPKTMRLEAELDERNYATIYDYNEEGKLIRIRKETEKGKMTIQENRNNTKK